MKYTVDQASDIVKAAGFGEAFYETRFPFTYHHDWVRVHSYAHGLQSRADVAVALHEKYGGGDDDDGYDDGYIRECIRGALLYLAQYPTFPRAWKSKDFRDLFDWAMEVGQ